MEVFSLVTYTLPLPSLTQYISPTVGYAQQMFDGANATGMFTIIAGISLVFMAVVWAIGLIKNPPS